MRFNSALSELETGSATTATLAMVSQIGAALSSTTSVPELVTALRQQLKWLLPAAYVSVCLLDDGDQHYTVIMTTGEEQTFSIREGLVGWALRHRVSLDLADLQDETQRPVGTAGLPADQAHGAVLILPLEAEGRLLGALTIGSPQIGAYEAVDRGLVSLITLQVTAALRTALLIAELDNSEAIIAGMARAVEAKDPYTRGHADRVTTYALALAVAAMLPIHVRDLIAHAGPLHDVGKIGVPDHVLSKPGRLTDEERALMEQHPVIGDEICRPLRALRRLRLGVRHHHERYDGGGYPDGLAGQNIPLEARVLAIADTYDAMTSNRPYRAGMPHDRAMFILATNEGPQWDPELIDIFCDLYQTSTPSWEC